MPLFSAAEPEGFLAFERGIDREDPRTMIRPGGYEAAENMLLASSASGKHLCTTRLDALLDPLMIWPAGNAIWCAPFTYSSYDATTRVLSYSTHLLIMRDTGQMIRYNVPVAADVAGTSQNVRRGFTGSALQVNHWAYDQWLCTADGRNAPMKYGQHFLWDGQLESTPYLFPIGSKPITPLVAGAAGETWVHSAGSGNAFRNDASVPQGSRVGTQSLRLNAGSNSAVTFGAVRDYVAPPQPYGGSDFTDTDYLVFSVICAVGGPTTGNVRIRFHDKTAPTTKYFTFTQAPSASSTAWSTFSLLRSAAVNTGTATWSNIGKVTLFNDDRSRDIYIDDLYWLYASAPPAGQVGTTHKNRILLGGAPVGATPGEPFLSTLVYSDAGTPDEYPSSNTQAMSGGAESMAKTNTITALREYNDAVIVGTPSAIFAWTIGESGNPAKSTVSTEHGIDSHRGVAETPSGSLIFPWQKGFYILRATGRQFVGAKIQPLLETMHVDDPSWTMTTVDEKTKTIRMCWREGTAPTRNTAGTIFDHVRSQSLGEPVWPSTVTQVFDYAAPAYINGVRETLYVKNNDPAVYRLHAAVTGTLESSVTLPWVNRGETKDHMVKWIGLTAPYTATVPVAVQIRYAGHPGEFDSAVFTTADTLPANPEITRPAKILFGGTAKWAQVRFLASDYGFELFPPVSLLEMATQRVA